MRRTGWTGFLSIKERRNGSTFESDDVQKIRKRKFLSGDKNLQKRGRVIKQGISIDCTKSSLRVHINIAHFSCRNIRNIANKRQGASVAQFYSSANEKMRILRV